MGNLPGAPLLDTSLLKRPMLGARLLCCVASTYSACFLLQGRDLWQSAPLRPSYGGLIVTK